MFLMLTWKMADVSSVTDTLYADDKKLQYIDNI